MKKFVNRLRFDRTMVISLWPRFLAHPVYRRLGWLPVSYFARVKYPRIAKAYRRVSYRREISFFSRKTQANRKTIVHQSCSLYSNKCIAVRKVATPLRELTCHMGSHSVTCHPAEVTFPPLPQPKLVLD